MKTRPRVHTKGRFDSEQHVHALPGGGYTGPAEPVGEGQHIHSSPQGPAGRALTSVQHTHDLPDGTKTGAGLEANQ